MRLLVAALLLLAALRASADSIEALKADYAAYESDFAKWSKAADELEAAIAASSLLEEQFNLLCADLNMPWEQRRELAMKEPGTAARLLKCNDAWKKLSARNDDISSTRDSVLKRQGELTERYRVLGERETALKRRNAVRPASAR